jgi:RNA-directed DNA polymerase
LDGKEDTACFFDNINHGWPIKFLERRIDDRAFIGLIVKWLKAGVLEEDGTVIHPETGTPQGGVISPVLANIYLHYVIDLWFETKVKTHCKGTCHMVRFADDFVCAFQFKKDAERFYRVLPKRLAKFGLECAPDKTKIIRFSRFGIHKNEAFDFLGFEYRWVKSRKGKSIIKRRTSRKKYRKALKNVTEFCRNNRHLKVRYLIPKFNDILRGHFDYYGVRLNSEDIQVFRYKARRILFKWLNRRSQRKSYTWEGFSQMEEIYPLTPARIRNKPVQLFFVFS